MRQPGERRRSLVLPAITWVCVAGFVGLEIVAMWLYPGGTWFDRSSIGYSLRYNFFCDLTASVALNDAPNPGAPFARVAMILLAVGMLPFWWSLAEFSRSRSRTRMIRATGIASGLAAVTVPFLSTHDVGALHGLATMTAGSFGLIAAAVGVIEAFRNRKILIAMLGASSFAAGFVVSAIYLPALLTHRDAVNLPLAQKVAAPVLLAWMLATVSTTRRAAQGPAVADGAN